MRKAYQIRTANDDEHRVVLGTLLALGYNDRYCKDTSLNATVKELKDYPYICVYPRSTGGGELGGNFEPHISNGPVLSLGEFLHETFINEVVVELNSSHVAIVTKDKIKVGCQTFPLSIVDDLAKAIASLKS